MSTTPAPLQYLWRAEFSDGTIIDQPADDRYSKHDENADYNPSAFRDVQDAIDEGKELRGFMLGSTTGPMLYALDLLAGMFGTPMSGADLQWFSLEDSPLTDRKIIFYREVNQHTVDAEVGAPYVNRYKLGYEGKNTTGEIVKHILYIDGR